jgi:hypothetical protein
MALASLPELTFDSSILILINLLLKHDKNINKEDQKIAVTSALSNVE